MKILLLAWLFFHSLSFTQENLLVALLNKDSHKEALKTFQKLPLHEQSQYLSSLLKGCKHQSAQIRIYAIKTLGKLPHESESSLPTLINAAHQDQNEKVRRYAVVTLGELRSPTEKILAALGTCLKDKHEDVRFQTIHTLRKFKNEAKNHVTLLASLLRLDPSSDVRYSAAQALGEIRGNLQVTLPALMRSLRDPDEYVREKTIQALGALGGDATEAFPLLLKAFREKDPAIQNAARASIRLIIKDSPSLRTSLIEDLKGTFEQKRLNAAYIFSLLGPEIKEAVPVLEESLKDSNWVIRILCVQALGQIGDPSVLPSLKALLNDPQKKVSRYAEWAIGELESPKTPQDSAKLLEIEIQQLLKKAQNQTGLSQYLAFQKLGNLGKKAESTIPALLKILPQTKEPLTSTLIKTLGQLHSPTVVPALLPYLQSEVSGIRFATANTLGQIASKEAKTALLEGLKHPSGETRLACIQALAKIGEIEPSKTLFPLLKDPQPEVRQAVLIALGELKIHSAQAEVEALLLQEKEKMVRLAAFSTLFLLQEKSLETTKTKKTTETTDKK